MFEKFKILKDVAVKLYPYFIPSYHNCVRTTGFVIAIIVVPAANFFIPKLFLRKDGAPEDNSNNFDVITALATVSVVALLSGAQQALSTMLTTSTMQAMKEQNVQLLMDKSKFLMHGNNKDITSLQYVTVGVGVRDFTGCAVPIFVSLPMYTITSASTIINIGIATGSFTTSAVVLGFVTASAVAMYISGKGYFFSQATNQKIENDLVGKVAFIEAHRASIPLMGASDVECTSVMQSLQKIDASIPKLSLLGFANVFIMSLAAATASQFLGGYYKDDSIQGINAPNAKVLNVMLMSLMTNVQHIVLILTANYAFVKLNLEQLNAFDKGYNDCLLTRNTNNKMKHAFEGDRLSLSDFCVYRPDPKDAQNMTLITLFNKVTLELLPNKVYKLSAESGSGKTTFLKAITNNWQYTEGVVKLPANATDNMCFIPQNSFIPSGTLLEILTYPLKPQKFLAAYPASTLIDETNLHALLEVGEKKNLIQNDSMSHSLESAPLLEIELIDVKENSGGIQRGTMSGLIEKVKGLLTTVKLLPGVIREDELESENINWNDRLSGGEKQKIGIIRALLANPKFIIMDEAAAALDPVNKQIVYEVVKSYITGLENYTVIYTEHGVTESFADTVLTISGQGLECYDII